VLLSGNADWHAARLADNAFIDRADIKQYIGLCVWFLLSSLESR